MKILSVLMVFALSMMLTSAHSQTVDYKRYKIKSAIVTYEISGMQSGTIDLYFDDYGVNEASYENTLLEMFGVTQETKTVNYLQGYWQYNLNLTTNTGTKTKNTMLEQIVNNAENADLEEVGMEMLVAMGGQKVGDEEFLGRNCEIWEIESMGTTVWIWNGISLKSETNMMGITMNRVATSIDENAVVPAEKLEIPDNVTFTEVDIDNIQNMMNGYQD